MATEFEIRHVFDVPAERFWKETFFDAEFNRALYVGHLGFARWELLREQRRPDGSIEREVLVEPRTEAPAVVRKLVGDAFHYVEKGLWSPEPAPGRYRFTAEPSRLADKVHIEGDFWVEPLGEQRCERIVRQRVEVRVFGVGKAVESYLERETRRSFDRGAEFTRRWLAERASR